MVDDIVLMCKKIKSAKKKKGEMSNINHNEILSNHQYALNTKVLHFNF